MLKWQPFCIQILVASEIIDLLAFKQVALYPSLHYVLYFRSVAAYIDSDVAKASVFVAEWPLEVFEVLSGAGSLQSIRLVELEHSPEK